MSRIVTALLVLLLSAPLHAQERLNYVVKLNGLVTLFSWTELAEAMITTANASCAGQNCLMTEVWMTSENYAALESIAPTRFFYRSFYQLNRQAMPPQAQTFAFEKRELKTGKKYRPYGHKHRVSLLEATEVVNYDLSHKGEALPAPVVSYVDMEYLQRRNLQPAVNSFWRRPAPTAALDRWTMIQLARYLPLAPGYSATFAGTDARDTLMFELVVEDQATLAVGTEMFSAWQVAISETEMRADGSKGEKAGTIHLWISQDDARLPLQLELKEDIGIVRFELTAFSSAAN